MESLKHAKNLFKISILLVFLLICLGSVYASDNSHFSLNEDSDDDFELDDEFDNDDLEDDEFEDDDLDDEFDNDDLEDDELDDDELDDDELDDDEFEDDDLDDFNESDYSFSDFDYLKLKITYYLDRYGNCSYYNWTESDEFLNEYQVYLLNPSNYTLNESSEGYQTYLKIYDSIISTFGEYNLTENETAYLKFMVIFYLNYYGNVSANYTWNESESFSNFTLPFDILGAMAHVLSGSASAFEFNHYSNIINPFISLDNNNSTDVNLTSTNNHANAEVPHSGDFNLIIFLIVVFLFVVFVMV